MMEERRKHSPPIQLRVPKGAVVFRDLRVWVRS
eukprot:COSAG04_NODE_19381_length_417_cov_1.405660_1_plen_32_part_10